MATTLEIMSQLEDLAAERSSLIKLRDAAYKRYKDYKAAYDQRIIEIENKSLWSKKRKEEEIAKAESGYLVQAESSKQQYDGYVAEINKIDDQVKELNKLLDTVADSAAEVSTILANQGLSQEALIEQAIQKGETDRYGLETTTVARIDAIRDGAATKKAAAEAEAENNRTRNMIIVSVVVVVLIIMTIVLIKRFKKPKAK